MALKGDQVLRLSEWDRWVWRDYGLRPPDREDVKATAEWYKQEAESEKLREANRGEPSSDLQHA